VIGGGDWSKDRIIPDVIRSLSTEKEVKVRNPNAIRPWQHVLEPLAGYLMLAAALDKEPLRFSKAYNFGPLPADHLTVKEIVERAIEAWGSGSWKDISDPNQPHEAATLKLNISRAQKELKWNPNLSAAVAIQWTIDWYRQPLSNMANYTFRQIKEYFTPELINSYR
jgi:CDP-glucose 4,6-dehydratase